MNKLFFSIVCLGILYYCYINFKALSDTKNKVNIVIFAMLPISYLLFRLTGIKEVLLFGIVTGNIIAPLYLIVNVLNSDTPKKYMERAAMIVVPLIFGVSWLFKVNQYPGAGLISYLELIGLPFGLMRVMKDEGSIPEMKPFHIMVIIMTIDVVSVFYQNFIG